MANQCGNQPDFSFMADVPVLWEDIRELRVRTMEGKPLLVGVLVPQLGRKPVVVGTLECVKLNAKVLGVILKLMEEKACLSNPPLYLLQGALLEFQGRNGFPSPDDMAGIAIQDSWGLKRMLSFLRRKFAKTETPRAACIFKRALCVCFFSRTVCCELDT